MITVVIALIYGHKSSHACSVEPCGLQDEGELEVFDNWEGQPGAAVMAGGKSSTRESK